MRRRNYNRPRRKRPTFAFGSVGQPLLNHPPPRSRHRRLVASVVQGVKKVFPNATSGKVAIGMNIALSLVGTIAECRTDPQKVSSGLQE
jgi:hypothetical protein